MPDRTSVTSRQLKQVRLLDRGSVPFDIVYHTDLRGAVDVDSHTDATKSTIVPLVRHWLHLHEAQVLNPIPANQTMTIRYRTQDTSVQSVTD